MLSSTKQKTQQISIFGHCTLNLTTSKHTFKDTMSQDGNQNVVKFFVLITLVKKHHTCSLAVKVLGLQTPEHKFESDSGPCSYLPLLNFRKLFNFFSKNYI